VPAGAAGRVHCSTVASMHGCWLWLRIDAPHMPHAVTLVYGNSTDAARSDGRSNRNGHRMQKLLAQPTVRASSIDRREPSSKGERRHASTAQQSRARWSLLRRAPYHAVALRALDPPLLARPAATPPLAAAACTWPLEADDACW